MAQQNPNSINTQAPLIPKPMIGKGYKCETSTLNDAKT